ncbi:SDR family oxidoreductase [Nocardioides carbamazepini]|uniref:SDR family NAD(P)-dependent oxidoreductase n=1 Tax=Nocardioides carbamazepini TaxID=2854259 RepID=UPI00214A6AE9|nr:SDR family oxidoreductase [Nocardioides carbamazepini]MCR1782441.1 SDR family oxidoreductase [Nocardioides carbamazepini]
MSTGWPSDLLSGQVAVVTGGSSGLGRATALRLAEAGVDGVVVADLRREPREGGVPTAEVLTELGVPAIFAQCDVTSVASLRSAVAAAEVMGGVSIMVPAAGILRMEDVLAVTESDYDAMLDVNVKGTFFACQAAARSMVAGGREGVIVTISSVGGVLGSASMPTYNISKGAVRMLTYSLAASLGPHGIRVNAVHPGVVETAMTQVDTHLADEPGTSVPLGRLGVPKDVADAIVYLASPLSAYTTGTSLFVDGGSHSSKAGRDFKPQG